LQAQPYRLGLFFWQEKTVSTLLVEVCEVAAVEKHPYADRLGMATVKGWKTAVGYDPATGQYEFQPGERCIYFPPDSVLPPALANSPYKVCKTKGCKACNKTPPQLQPPQQAKDGKCSLCGNEVGWKDGTPGRTGAMAFCAELPCDEQGVRPAGGRVKAARIRGLQSFGFIMKIDPAQGDDPNWSVGTDLREHFGVGKWEPPIENVDGEVETPHPFFHTYTDIEHLANYPEVISEGEEVIFTEKLHGKNSRVGLVLAKNETGALEWTWMAGSHGQRRKEVFPSPRRFVADQLVEQLVLPSTDVQVGTVFAYDGGKFWRVIEVKNTGKLVDLRTEEVYKTGMGGYEVRLRRSEFWEPLTENVKLMLTHVRDEHPRPEPKQGIVLFGEAYGTQDMRYGLKNARGFRAFDIAINGKYLDFDVKRSLFAQFGVEMVPVLYRGPLSAALVEQHTDGPTTMCKAEEAGVFGGREGIVVTPVVERIAEQMMVTSTNGRVIFKSVSADYLARKGGTDAH
jgi:hypothetical protein